MTRKSSLIPPKKSGERKKHVRSAFLERDPRVSAAPRTVTVLHSSPVCMVKIYGILDSPGSELMTVSVVHDKTGMEYEIGYDEKFPISMRFKKQSDEERVAFAKEQIVRACGFEKLATLFNTIFGKFGDQ